MRQLLFAALLLASCAPPAVLSPRQWEFLRTHPEMGEAGRQAMLSRTVAVGQTFERVAVTWDGVRAERYKHAQGDRVDVWVFTIPVGGRSVWVRGAGQSEEIPYGKVLATFRDQVLITYVRLE